MIGDATVMVCCDGDDCCEEISISVDDNVAKLGGFETQVDRYLSEWTDWLLHDDGGHYCMDCRVQFEQRRCEDCECLLDDEDGDLCSDCGYSPDATLVCQMEGCGSCMDVMMEDCAPTPPGVWVDPEERARMYALLNGWKVTREGDTCKVCVGKQASNEAAINMIAAAEACLPF